MTQNRYHLIPIFFALLATPTLWGQAPLNDECSGATLIADPSDYCTPLPGGNNSTATPSPQPVPSCFVSGAQADVWYTFTAVATNLYINLKGLGSPSIFEPQLAVYSGACNNLTEEVCAYDPLYFTDLPPIALYNLVVGQQYFIRIDGDTPGRFEFCIKNIEFINEVSGDCPTATFICSKDSIVVGKVYGAGNDPDEMSSSPCHQGIYPETSAAWYVFTAANDGDLVFTITPHDPNDDLDFVLYRLPNGPGDCTGKITERCTAAGSLNPLSPCMGPAGLDFTSTETSQFAGCGVGMDNFLRFLTLTPGATYALLINNFTAIGHGITIEWGGDAQFKGATTANFITDEPDKKICLGEEMLVTDSSFTTDGIITSWHWNFGSGAIPNASNGQGPVTVQYQTLGPKAIVLTVTNDEGCISLDTAYLLVENCCVFEAEVTVAPGCPDAPGATATLELQNGVAPFFATWSNGQTGNSLSTTITAPGNYSVSIEDATGCLEILTFTATTPLNLSAMFPPDTSIYEGGTVTLAVSTTPANSLAVWWIDPKGDTLTGPVQVLMPIETSTYFVMVTSADCVFTDSVTVVVEEVKYERPNAFTPNGDGANDTFGPVLVGHTLLRLEVWSRWGEKVFDSQVEGNNTWDGNIDGEPAPSDVYVYRVWVRFASGEEDLKSGDVTLLR